MRLNHQNINELKQDSASSGRMLVNCQQPEFVLENKSLNRKTTTAYFVVVRSSGGMKIICRKSRPRRNRL